MARAAAKKDEEISTLQIQTETATFYIVGVTPLIENSMSAKSKQNLLFPPPKKNQAERASSLKHDPLREYRDCPYRIVDDKAPTLIGMPAVAFKAALRSAALDMPGAAKAQIGRLTFVRGELLPIWGSPKMLMSVTRSADMNKTPDIRTRCIIPQWASMVEVTYVVPLLKQQTVVNLFGAAGLIRGVGDWRAEKGSGTFGQFEIVNEDDERWHEIVAAGGRAEQARALRHPTFYDIETAELYSWFTDEVKRRGFNTGEDGTVIGMPVPVPTTRRRREAPPTGVAQ